MKTIIAITFLSLVVGVQAAGWYPHVYTVAETDTNGGGEAFTVYATTFVGTNYISRDIGTATNSKQALISVWVNPGSSRDQIICEGNNNDYDFYINADQTMTLKANNAGGTPILLAVTSLTVTNNGWSHVLWSLDLSDVAKRFVYVNDAADPAVTWTTYSDDTINWNTIGHGVGGSYTGGYLLVGCLSEVYINPVYMDISNTTNRRKFISAGKLPVDLGADGSTPTGGKPMVYLHSAYGSFTNNVGYLGVYTHIEGELTTCTPPQ